MRFPQFLLLSTLAIASNALGQTPHDHRFTTWDKDKDGKLSREELPEPLRRNFSRVDTDTDGFISLAEHQAVIQRIPQDRPNHDPIAGRGVAKSADLDYAGNDNPRQKLDLYLPEKRTDNPLPVVCWIHGGGWKSGDKRNAGSVARLVATGKYAGISIGYRLSGEAQWPAQIHDCKAAIRWIRANAEKYNLDPDKIAVWGSSAGGHLAAMLGVSHNVADLEGTVGRHMEQSSEVTCAVDFFGPTELLTMSDHASRIDHDAPDSPEAMLIGGPIQENKDRAENASPITHVSKDDEPILIVHGTKDDLVPYPQSVAFKKKLESAGVAATLVTVEDGGHGNGFGPTIPPLVETFLSIHLLGAKGVMEDRTVPAGK